MIEYALIDSSAGTSRRLGKSPHYITGSPLKPVRALVLMTILMAPLDPRGAGAEEETPPASGEKGYFRRHLLHWVTAFGTSYADGQYEDQVGVSTHPLLFSDPPWIDRWARQGARGPGCIDEGR